MKITSKVSQIVTLTKHNDIDQHLQPATEQGVSVLAFIIKTNW